MEIILQNYMETKYHSYCSTLMQWDSIIILFENGHFGWFYIDIDNEIVINNNNNQCILWLISPTSNYKYDEFLRQLAQKSQC